MKIKNAALLILAAAMMTPVMASCGETAGNTDTPDAKNPVQTNAVTEAETEELDSLAARKLISDNLGEFDFGGYEYRIVTTDNKSDTIVCEATTGDVIDDAVYARNLAVEERFNTKITVAVDKPYTEAIGFMTKSVSAGEDAFDITSAHVVGLGQVVPSGYFLNWYNIPHIDFTQPWWSESNINDLTYNGVCIAAVGDMAVSAMSAAYCVFYNKVLGANYDMPNMYEVVNQGKFTLDYLVELSKDIYVDMNQNGAVDNDDLYGYTSDCQSNINTYLWAFDNPVFRKVGDKLEYVYKTDKMPDIVEKLTNTFTQYQGIRTDTKYVSAAGNSHGYSRDMFQRSLSIFANGYISMSLTNFRDMTDDFGILPYPKWDEAQESYYTMADGHHEALAVPKTASDLERIGVITEALCAESYKILMPAYYDVALKVKSARDEESIAMLDMIVNSRVFDFGYVYDGWGGASFFLQSLIQSKNANFESFYAKKEKSVLKYYTKVTDYFENYED